MTKFKLPDLGEGLQEAEIVTWHVGVGDRVVADQPLVSVETDKAVVEVPSPRAGRVAKLCAEPGDIVKIGEALIEYDDGNDKTDSGTVVGVIENRAELIDERRQVEGTPGAAPVKATPAVRALARRHGIDLSIVSPSGRGGMITAADVDRAAETLAEAGPIEPLRGVRRAMAQRMAQARDEVAPATVMDDADVHAWPKNTDPTLRLIRAIAVACAAEPSLNAWFDSREAGRRLHAKIDLGVAVDTADGLFVPVLHDIANRDPADLRRGLDRMKTDVEARTVPSDEMRGATISLSNFGTLAGRYAAPVVVPPQVAIFSAGRIADRVVVAAGKPAVHRTVPLSLTFDHRAVTGGEAARFLTAAIADLEKAK
jgi:pyruvate dehydrogenase E2 component (dihydrolipoamide acetyltransferase)